VLSNVVERTTQMSIPSHSAVVVLLDAKSYAHFPKGGTPPNVSPPYRYGVLKAYPFLVLGWSEENAIQQMSYGKYVSSLVLDYIPRTRGVPLCVSWN
jgi:hypothetical protein